MRKILDNPWVQSSGWFMTILGIFWFVLFVLLPDGQTTLGRIESEIRGNVILVIRSERDPIYDVVINNDGIAAHRQPPHFGAAVTLSPAVFSGVQDIATTWCAHRPVFDPPGTNEVFYTVAFPCGLATNSLRVPTHMMPDALIRTLQEVPTP